MNGGVRSTNYTSTDLMRRFLQNYRFCRAQRPPPI